MVEEIKPPKAPKAVAAEGEKTTTKKPKEPALEDKPFTEFMEQDFAPSLKSALDKVGLKDLTIQFHKQAIPLSGAEPNQAYWQIIGTWQSGQRQFQIYFLDETIAGQKAFSYSTGGNKPSTLESFMIDERKVTLDLMVNYTLQRLNGQKWLARN
jgi:hypothetical protein